jgi:GNAT superfamily N-acetyltransferase
MTRAVSSDDARGVLDQARTVLQRDPVANNLVLTLLEQASGSSTAGTFWLALDARGDARAVALRWPASMHAAISSVPLDLVGVLVEAVARDAPELSGVLGDVPSASAFAGAWVEQCHRGAEPVEGQRIHRLTQTPPLPAVEGELRPARSRDVPLVSRWSERFAAETGLRAPGTDDMNERIRRREVWLWDAGGPVAMAAATAPVARVARVGLVYTPPELRRRGYAGACVGSLSAQLLSTVANACVLYTQLSNPVSNSVYRRIGYEPVVEVMRYRFR